VGRARRRSNASRVRRPKQRTTHACSWLCALRRKAVLMLVPERVRKCVSFLGIKEGDQFRPRATAFAVVIDEEQYRWHYIVTAEHVVARSCSLGHDLWLRINMGGAEPAEIKIDPPSWYFHPNSAEAATDVAVCPISFDHSAEIDPVPIYGPRSVAATRAVINDVRIGVGDEVIVAGLFRSHYGQERNIPIIRVGNVAMLDGDPVKTKNGNYVDAYLIEARSIGGLSGSPAFVHLPAIRTIDGKTRLSREKPFYEVYLLGLMHGHFDVEDLNLDVVLDDAKDASSGIHSGIGVVIPVEKIIDTVMQLKLVEARRKIVRESTESRGIISEA
jgi:hypothetical protein